MLNETLKRILELEPFNIDMWSFHNETQNSFCVLGRLAYLDGVTDNYMEYAYKILDLEPYDWRKDTDPLFNYLFGEDNPDCLDQAKARARRLIV